MKGLRLAIVFCAAALACGGGNTAVNRGDAPGAPVAPAPASATPAADEFASIRATYNAACVRCHKENGEGGLVELDEGARLKVPSFKAGHALKHDDAEYARQIAKGGEGMPAFGRRLSPEQINELVRFIRREFQAGLTTGQGAH